MKLGMKTLMMAVSLAVVTVGAQAAYAQKKVGEF